MKAKAPAPGTLFWVPALIAVVVALIAACSTSGGNSSPSSPGEVASPPTSAANALARPNQPVVVEATPTPMPDRQVCEQVRGSDYRSDKERDWYLANCLPTPTPKPLLPPVPAPNPPVIPGAELQGERWVLIDIASQTASAMIGDRLLYRALVTTGKDGWVTPTGNFAIQYRVANETMTSVSIGAEEYYVLKDVLYTQYFTFEGHALHLNYWRDDSYFGNVRSSHGCIGMRLADAEFFWRFANVGTRVTII